MHIIIIFRGYNLDISGLAAELRFFWGAAVVANVGPIVQKGAGNKRHHPVRSSTRGCLGAGDRGVGQWVDEDARILTAAESRSLLAPGQAHWLQSRHVKFCCQALVRLYSSTHRGARTHDHKVKGLALCRLS